MISEAVETFVQIKNIPYQLGVKGVPDEILKTGRGNCTSKHLLLGRWLGEMGYKNVAIGSVQFDWEQIPIPVKYLKLLGPDTMDQHSFLLIDGYPVDATWDSGMKRYGFPVFDWDGVGATGIGVKPVGEIQTYELNYLLARVYAGGYIDIMRKIIRGPKKTPFNDAVNAWLGRNL